MITEYPARSGVLCQIRNWRGGVGRGVFAAGDDGGEGAGGGVGEGGPDGALVHVVVVEQFEAECLVGAGLEAGGRAGEDVAEQGQVVQEVRVNVALGAPYISPHSSSPAVSRPPSRTLPASAVARRDGSRQGCGAAFGAHMARIVCL